MSDSRSDAPPRGVAVIGAGDHGRVVASVLRAAGVAIAGHYDDDPTKWGAILGGAKVIGPIDDTPRRAPAIIAIGDNRVRQQLAERLDLEWITVVHPFSWLCPDVRLGPGTVVCAGALIQVGAQIGAHVILNNRAGVGHDCRVGDYAHISVAHLGGGASAGVGTLIGMGSVVLPRVTVGDWAIVGAGATVTSDVRSRATVVGSPAREMTPRRRSAHSGGASDEDPARMP